jgi:hypothetical protein
MAEYLSLDEQATALPAASGLNGTAGQNLASVAQSKNPTGVSGRSGWPERTAWQYWILRCVVADSNCKVARIANFDFVVVVQQDIDENRNGNVFACYIRRSRVAHDLKLSKTV